MLLVDAVSATVEADEPGPAMRLIEALEARLPALDYVNREMEAQRCRLLRRALRWRDKDLFFALLEEPG